MNVEPFKLNDQQFDADYKNAVRTWTGEETTLLSLTFTLNPRLNSADILSQYRAILKELRHSNIFYYRDKIKKGEFVVHKDFIKMFIVPELTKTLNIHLHGIFICVKGSENYFINEFRRLCWKNEVLGRQHTVKVVDNNIQSKDAIECYALKDLSEMNKVIDRDKIYKYKFVSE